VNANWLIAAATIVLAGVGIVTFFANRQLVQATKDQAEKTAASASATEKAAEAAVAEAAASRELVEETRRDQKLAAQPFLRFWRTLERTAVSEEPYPVAVENIGRGPAIACQYWGCDLLITDGNRQETYFETLLAPLSPSYGVNLEQVGRTQDKTYAQIEVAVRPYYPPPGVSISALDGLLVGDQSKRVDAILCLDILGNRYRFVSGQGLPEESPRGDLDPPPWASALPSR
jgi:hypothetical protein